MYYMRTCLTDGHVLQEYTYYEWTCIIENMIKRRTCLTGWHVQHKDRFYSMTCFAGGHVNLEDMW